MTLSLTGYSSALYATWFFVEEFGILFDAGDGAVASLGGKTGKIRHIFITHADRDHLTGLLQLLQLNTQAGKPYVYYPEDSGSFPALKTFIDQFDPQSGGATWVPVNRESRIQIKPHVYVEVAENQHVRTQNGELKSVSYFLTQEKRKLKPAFDGVDGSEIGRLRNQHGNDHVSDRHSTTLLAYSGDSPVVPDSTFWKNPEVLIHEATFLEEETLDLTSPAYNLHSHLAGVMASLADLPLKALVLSHFSTRYGHQEICDAISAQCRKLNIAYPVHAVLPMRCARNILESVDLNPKSKD